MQLATPPSSGAKANKRVVLTSTPPWALGLCRVSNWNGIGEELGKTSGPTVAEWRMLHCYFKTFQNLQVENEGYVWDVDKSSQTVLKNILKGGNSKCLEKFTLSYLCNIILLCLFPDAEYGLNVLVVYTC